MDAFHLLRIILPMNLKLKKEKVSPSKSTLDELTKKKQGHVATRSIFNRIMIESEQRYLRNAGWRSFRFRRAPDFRELRFISSGAGSV